MTGVNLDLIFRKRCPKCRKHGGIGGRSSVVGGLILLCVFLSLTGMIIFLLPVLFLYVVTKPSYSCTHCGFMWN